MAIASVEQVKSRELERALEDAQEEMVAGVQLNSDVLPSGQAGFWIRSENPDVLNIDALIFREKDSDIVQFAFVDDIDKDAGRAGIAPAAAAAGGRYTLGFLAAAGKSQGRGPRVSGRGSWAPLAALSIRRRPATDALAAIARMVEQHAKPNPGFIAMESGLTTGAGDAQLNAAHGKRVLLFVHGIFSSIEGGFHALGDPGQDSTMKALLDRYDGNVFGYDHWTISKTPLQNALELLLSIPADAHWTVDLVCHSRGGLIARALFADPDAAVALRTPELREIQELRKGRIAQAGKVIFVAGANQGSPLARPDELQKFLKIAGVLASTSHGFALDVVIGLLRALVASAYELPSIEQLDSTRSDLIFDLNNKEVASAIAPGLAYGVRANFDPAGWSWQEAAALVETCLMPEPNDLVVPYAGVAIDPPIPDQDSRMRDFERNASQSAVWHTNYFERQETRAFLLQHLTA